MATEGKCNECEHAIFCPSFGEYKCELYCHRVYFPDMYRVCFKKSKTPVLEKKCRCEVCVERGYIDDEMEE